MSSFTLFISVFLIENSMSLINKDGVFKLRFLLFEVVSIERYGFPDQILKSFFLGREGGD